MDGRLNYVLPAAAGRLEEWENQQQPLLLSQPQPLQPPQPPPQPPQLLEPQLHPPQHTMRRMMIRIQLQLLPHILSNLLLIDVRHSMQRRRRVLQ